MTFTIALSRSRIGQLSISGALDAETASQLGPMLDMLFTRVLPKLEIDLSGLRMIDSIGVGLLVAVHKRLRARGIVLTFRGLRDQPLMLFKLLRLDRLIAESEAELC